MAYFFDTSALVKRYHQEDGTAVVDAAIENPGERGLLPEGTPTEQEAQRLYAFPQHIFEGVLQRPQNSGETQ